MLIALLLLLLLHDIVLLKTHVDKGAVLNVVVLEGEKPFGRVKVVAIADKLLLSLFQCDQRGGVLLLLLAKTVTGLHVKRIVQQDQT